VLTLYLQTTQIQTLCHSRIGGNPSPNHHFAEQQHLMPNAQVMDSRLRGNDEALFSKGKYGILGAVPTNYGIDKKGIVRFADVGSFEDAEFAAVIEPLLRE
jgi:hypothetical protein